MIDQTIHTIPLLHLHRAPENVRPVEDHGELQSLADDIAAHGLLQSLVGYRSDDHDAVAIVAGSRRLAALELLLQAKKVPVDYAVPVLLIDQKNAGELSLAENITRRAMNPADEYAAYAHLVSAGDKPAAIAKRFGTTELHVKQRLRLAQLAPDILEALRQGKMGVDGAMAYASVLSHKAQMRVFKLREKDTWHKHKADMIRQALRDDATTADAPLSKYVGKAAYTAAGGRIEADLFNDPDKAMWQDLDIIIQLAKAKAEKDLLKRAKDDGAAITVLMPTLEPPQWGVKMPKPPKGWHLIEDGYQSGYALTKVAEIEATMETKPERGLLYAVQIVASKAVLMPVEKRFYVNDAHPYIQRKKQAEKDRAAAGPARRETDYRAERVRMNAWQGATVMASAEIWNRIHSERLQGSLTLRNSWALLKDGDDQADNAVLELKIEVPAHMITDHFDASHAVEWVRELARELDQAGCFPEPLDPETQWLAPDGLLWERELVNEDDAGGPLRWWDPDGTHSFDSLELLQAEYADHPDAEPTEWLAPNGDAWELHDAGPRGGEAGQMRWYCVTDSKPQRFFYQLGDVQRVYADAERRAAGTDAGDDDHTDDAEALASAGFTDGDGDDQAPD